jgi:hypothetical protein
MCDTLTMHAAQATCRIDNNIFFVSSQASLLIFERAFLVGVTVKVGWVTKAIDD